MKKSNQADPDIRCCDLQYYCRHTDLLTSSDFTRTTQAGPERPLHSVFQPLPAASVPCCTLWATQQHNYINGAASLKGNATKFKNLNSLNVLPVVCSNSRCTQSKKKEKIQNICNKTGKWGAECVDLWEFLHSNEFHPLSHLLEMLDCALDLVRHIRGAFSGSLKSKLFTVSQSHRTSFKLFCLILSCG